MENEINKYNEINQYLKSVDNPIFKKFMGDGPSKNEDPEEYLMKRIESQKLTSEELVIVLDIMKNLHLQMEKILKMKKEIKNKN